MVKRAVYDRFLFVHRWFGLIAGFYFMLIGTSGAFLVYSWHFESWLNPSLRRAEISVKDYDLSQVMSAAARAMESSSLPQSFRAPDGDALNIAVTFAKPLDGDKPEVRTAFVDPSTASYTGQIDPDKTVSEFLFDFHHELFLGRTGKTIVAVCGILILILFGTGFYLWWPKRRFIWRSLQFPRFRTSYQFLYDWHKLWGVYTFALMIMMVGSGIYIAQPQWFEGPKEKKEGEGKKPFVALPLDTMNFQDFARELSAKDIPLRPLRLQFNAEKKLVTIRTKFPDGSNRRLSYDISQKTFEEVDLKAEPFEMKALQHDLHEGKYWGGKGSVLSFLAGLTTLILFFSGFFIWWGRASRRKLRKNS